MYRLIVRNAGFCESRIGENDIMRFIEGANNLGVPFEIEMV